MSVSTAWPKGSGSRLELLAPLDCSRDHQNLHGSYFLASLADSQRFFNATCALLGDTHIVSSGFTAFPALRTLHGEMWSISRLYGSVLPEDCQSVTEDSGYTGSVARSRKSSSSGVVDIVQRFPGPASWIHDGDDAGFACHV